MTNDDNTFEGSLVRYFERFRADPSVSSAQIADHFFQQLVGETYLLTFNDWMKNQPEEDTPVGDFLSDAKQDKKFPSCLMRWKELEDYLSLVVRASDACIAAAKLTWGLYLIAKWEGDTVEKWEDDLEDNH